MPFFASASFAALGVGILVGPCDGHPHDDPIEIDLHHARVGAKLSVLYLKVCGEYFAEQPTEVAYRGETGALFKRDFGGMYQSLFPELKLRKQGFLGKAEGWDDVTYWVFERT